MLVFVAEVVFAEALLVCLVHLVVGVGRHLGEVEVVGHPLLGEVLEVGVLHLLEVVEEFHPSGREGVQELSHQGAAVEVEEQGALLTPTLVAPHH